MGWWDRLFEDAFPELFRDLWPEEDEELPEKKQRTVSLDWLRDLWGDYGMEPQNEWAGGQPFGSALDLSAEITAPMWHQTRSLYDVPEIWSDEDVARVARKYAEHARGRDPLVEGGYSRIPEQKQEKEERRAVAMASLLPGGMLRNWATPLIDEYGAYGGYFPSSGWYGKGPWGSGGW